MQRGKGRWVVLICALSLPSWSTAFSAPDSASKDKGSKTKESFSPEKVLKVALGNLSKQKNYEVKLSHVWGARDDLGREIDARWPRYEWVGQVYGDLMHVPAMKAYRTPTKGVAKLGTWKSLEGTFLLLGNTEQDNARRMHKRFSFPLTVLSQAARHSPKAEWRSEAAPGAVPQANAISARAISVQVPPEAALKLFNSLQFPIEGSSSRTSDNPVANASYEITMDSENRLPEKIEFTILAAVLKSKGTNEVRLERGKIIGGKHFVFSFKYELSRFEKLKPLEVPPEAAATLK